MPLTWNQKNEKNLKWKKNAAKSAARYIHKIDPPFTVRIQKQPTQSVANSFSTIFLVPFSVLF